MSPDFSSNELERLRADPSLSVLYNLVCDCPNPNIAAAMKALITGWLEKRQDPPELVSLADLLEKLTGQEMLEVSWLLAINPNTPPSVLEQLCSNASDALLERIAENSGAAQSTLTELSYQAIAEIRIATAGNPQTPIASIMLLIQDENPDVRYSMAENHSLPIKALRILAEDDNPFVKFRAEKTLTRLNQGDLK